MADVGLLALAKEYTDNKITELIDIIYPVGSVYVSVNNVSPATLFGGTWVQIKDRFLLSAGDTYNGGATGGAATHTLTASEMPKHRHGMSLQSSQLANGNYYSRVVTYTEDLGNDLFTGYSGDGKAHNNMPPYLVVYVYKRTA